MATTPCPFCHADVHVPRSDTGSCRACGEALRFIDAPEVSCGQCGKPIPYIPGKEAAHCRCGHWQAVDGRRAVRFEATCPRCRRTIDVPATGDQHTCPHCRAAIVLQDTF